MKAKVTLVVACACLAILAESRRAQAGDGSGWVADVRGMSCPLCAKNIEKQLSKIQGIVEVSVDLGSGQVKIRYATGYRGDEKTIAKAIEDAGFSVAKVKEVP